MGQPDARRDALRALLANYEPRDAVEAAALDEFQRTLGVLDRPFDEEAQTTHVTASVVVVGERGVLLHRHRRLGLWLQPGGHIEAGEQPPDAALRECREETGLSADHPPSGPLVIHLDVHDSAKGHRHLDLRYLGLGPDADPTPPSGESQEVEWCSWEEAYARADASLAAALNEARRMAGEVLPDVGGPGEET